MRPVLLNYQSSVRLSGIATDESRFDTRMECQRKHSERFHVAADHYILLSSLNAVHVIWAGDTTTTDGFHANAGVIFNSVLAFIRSQVLLYGAAISRRPWPRHSLDMTAYVPARD